jgi:hypothetical protein
MEDFFGGEKQSEKLDKLDRTFTLFAFFFYPILPMLLVSSVILCFSVLFFFLTLFMRSTDSR